MYSFNRENVQWFENYFLVESGETRGRALSALDKMKIILRVMANPSFQNEVGEKIGINQTSVLKIYTYVLNRIVSKAHI